MFYSHCLLTRKGPLGAIWVAAYYFKKLKKTQVFETDIPSSVDKILQDQFEVLTYRVLAYLLLGIVRIYSRKVEYLYHDCNEVLVQIKDFVVQKKDKAQTEILRTPYFSITLPKSFELDAFDLGILEDANEHNVRPQEDITLKDVACSSQGSGQYSLDKYHCEFAASYDTFPMDCNQTEDELSFHFMDIDTEARMSEVLCNLDEIVKKIQCDMCFQEENLHHESFLGTEEAAPDPVRSYDKGYDTDPEHVEVPEVVQSENLMCREANREKHDDRFSQEECVNLRSEIELEPLGATAPCGQDHTNEEKINDPNTEQLNNEIDPAMEAESDTRNLEFEASIEKLRDNRLPQEGVQQPSELVRPFGNEDCPDVEQMKFPGASTSKDRGHKVIAEDHPISVNTDATPKSKLPDASAGFTAPDFMLIRTPANKERAQRSRKRRCVFDDMIVFPNKVLKQWINNPSDLVCKRKNGVHNARAAWNKPFISNLVHGFSEPSVPCTSELRSLHHRRNLKVREYVETIKTPERLEVPAPAKPLETLQISTPPVGRSPEQREIAPQTPIQHSTSLRSYGRPEHSHDVEEEPIDVAVCEYPIGREQKEPSVSIDVYSHAIESEEKGPPPSVCTKIGGEEKEPSVVVSAHSIETKEKEPSVSKDQELNLHFMSEEVFSCGDGDIQEQDGWSERTRLVAKFLRRTFLDKKKRGEEEKVHMLQLLRGKTKKESSRLFYEILVLKTKGLVDVEQDNAFGDILVSKTPQCDQTYRADGGE
ncbi:hypothetical protein SLEP1_g19624 [Rubroshorea leprosula]|uniref:Sister chromatid cohesion 1 protein 2 n=1 Tax=Rubroshorea leprosula TaxID=152421 RepID=A0AAV5J987_9ROSI|nr:hypothetical protein SLEP1_g19624 [Rubroshorea leprosula]